MGKFSQRRKEIRKTRRKREMKTEKSIKKGKNS
jgi:hypothetical protein